ncbi:PqqD family protein [Caldicellulosiruptor acetigenus]|uniref:PqqD family protein n=1 Tax=Caldicellulosiruptor acetigenus 6A TaxID=632516 RepID=G2PTL4_9FIRM|nr:PqqD family protein [Caldicellulosiruptor acetigenus]AEM74295.1 hypothetical protein Calla_1703 [Caldicellulosiruptor acetigenus 6A]
MKKEYIVPAPDIGYAKIDDLIVVYSLKNENYCIFNETATFIWECLVNGITDPEEIATNLANSFDCSIETALNDVNEFINELIEKKLVLENN